MKTRPALMIVIAFTVISSCGEKLPTPPEVEDAYLRLKSDLDDDTPGQSIDRLEAFRNDYGDYLIGVTAKEEIERLRGQVEGRYHLARELAREGDLERAEKILTDLTTYFPGSDDGEMAKEYMRYEFHIFKATRMMMDERFDEAEEALREVLTHDLSRQESENAERQLDGLTNARRGHEISRVHGLRSACQQLRVMLMMYRAEHGRFPGKLSIDSPEIEGAAGNGMIRRHISAIEDYRVTKKGFSLVAVGTDRRTRFHVTSDGVDAGE